MAPCQVHPIILHTNSSTISAAAAAARTPPVRPTGGVRRNLFGQPDQREMVRHFDNENARQRKRLENYKIIETIAQTKEIYAKTEFSNDADDANVKGANDKSLLPSLIAQELEAHEKELLKQKNKCSSTADNSDKDDDASLVLRRRELIETTPTALITKSKLRTVHINRTNEAPTVNEAARYKPYLKQTLITDAMPKRKAIPPP